MSRRLHFSVLATVTALLVMGCSRVESGYPVPAIDTSLAEQKVPGGNATSAIPLAPQPVRTESNVPMTKLAPGQKPPQFVLFSFDGVGLNPNWEMFLDTAQRVDARFSALMTGLYFLTDDNADRYQGPGHPAGKAAIAFGGDKEAVLEQVEYLNRTWLAGHEMGTHYVGHFCKGSGSHGDQWTSSEWTHELNQFFSLMANWRTNNDITHGPDLLFGPEAVRGGRTQCLEGTLNQMIPAWHEFGMTWDSSKPASHAGISWPYLIDGIWEFPIPYVYSPPLGKHQTALDYNFWFTLNGAKNEPRTTRRGHDIAKGTYDYMFEQAYRGNRAPLVIANHFNDWNGNAFNPATADFMAEVCDLPETYCATYSDVTAWMEMQDPEMLAHWQHLAPVAVGPV